MRQALIIGHGNPLVFFTLPLALPLMIVAIIIFFWPVIAPLKAKLFGKKA
jgi:TctA family transporter